MHAALKPAVWFIWNKLREILPEILLRNPRQIQRTKARCVKEIRVFPQADQLGVARRMAPPLNLTADITDLHLYMRLQYVRQR